MRCLYWLVAVASCADPGVPPQFTLMQVATIEGRLTVEGPTYRMAFSATGVKMPEQLFINEVDRLAPASCNADMLTEGQIGASVFPAITATAGVTANAAGSTATTLIEGPALVRVAVNYNIDYMCPGAQTLQGTSTFTMLPTGRIVRRDSITPSTDTLTPNATCGCEAGGGNLSFSTFYAFEPQNAQQVNATGAALADGTAQGCTVYPDAAIAVSFDSGQMTRSSGAGLHILDFERDTASLSNTTRDTTSAIQVLSDEGLAPPQCGDFLGLLAVTQLLVNGVPRDTDLDGVFNDEGVVHTGTITLTHMDTDIPAGFAIQLDLGGATHATVSRPVDRVFRQRGPGNTWFFVFQDGIEIGDSITIVPE